MEHKSIKTILVGLVVFAGFLLSPTKSVAQYYSQGANFKSLNVDKKVRIVHKTDYLDNIDANTGVLYHQDEIEFKIDLENNGSEVLKEINVTDLLPKGLDINFTAGNLDKGANSIYWKIDELNPGEIKTLIIKARINAMETNGLQINRVEANAGDVGDKDTASYYVGESYVPVTGGSPLMTGTLLVILVMSVSLFSRKVIRGYLA